MLQITKTKINAAEVLSTPNPAVLRNKGLHEKNMVIMLMVIVTVFVVCNIFSNVVWVLFYYAREATKLYIPYLWSISLLLETLNSSINVIIYATFNQKFRKTFVKLFCSCFKNESSVQLRISKSPLARNGRRNTIFYF